MKEGQAIADVSTASPAATDPWETEFLKKKKWTAVFRTKQFWIILVLGQILALCITSTNTFTSLLSMNGANIPGVQTIFNYALLTFVFTPYTMYRVGVKGWARLVYREGWKFIILAFFDCIGNILVIKAYGYTNILSAQLINFWAIVVVVVLSFFLLKVRYHWTQIIGILICIGGTGLLIASDHIQGSNGGSGPDPLKGDLFALLGATLYGFSNVTEEFLVSKKTLYEVIGQLSFWGLIINGVYAAIFERESVQITVWTSQVGAYFVGFTLCLFLFYCLAPILFRMSSAAFFNISLLTGNFWGLLIGLHVFGLTVHFLYPIAFVLIVFGLIVYYVRITALGGESFKPWLGQNQEKGIVGLGTARLHRPEEVEEPLDAQFHHIA